MRPRGLWEMRAATESLVPWDDDAIVGPVPSKLLNLARPEGFEPSTPGSEGRSYKPIRDGPRQFLLILQAFSKVGGNRLPPATATECHTAVTPQRNRVLRYSD